MSRGLLRPLTALLVAAAGLAWAAPADAQVGSGPLRASVTPDPWRVQLSDSAGAPVLSEHPGLGLGPTGTLGFRTVAGWFHATRVQSGGQSGGSFVAQLDTTDPLRDISVRITPSADGVLGLSASIVGPTAGVDAIGMGFVARQGERYLGFGERSNAVDQRGNAVQNYVSDGPYLQADRALVAAVIPLQGQSPRDDATYFPMPWLLSTAGYGVLLSNTETSYFRLGSSDAGAWSVEAEATSLQLSFVGGPQPADVVRRLTGITGRQPAPAAPWVLGPWYQPTGQDQVGQARSLRAGDVPASAVNTYLHYLPCGDQRGIEAQQPPRTSAFHDAGYAITTYFNPMICDDYNPEFTDAAAAGALNTNALDQPYLYNYAASPTTPDTVGQFDFSAPAGRQFYAGLLSEAVSHGYDGWMEDFGEYTPLDAKSANGMPGTQMHNLYPTLYHCASWDYAKTRPTPPVAFVRSGWTGTHSCAQVVWGGDPSTEWDFDGIRSAITQALSLGTSGISRWGSDIGGFFTLTGDELTPEMLNRWIQLGAVSGVMRTEANGVGLGGPPRPQIFDSGVLPTWRRYAKLRTQLYPYIAAADAEYRRTGMPVMRHHALTDPADPAAVAREDQFMFGPDLLAAPVHDPGQTTRSLYVPAGKWIDFWRAISYEPGGGGFALRRASLVDGGREVQVPAPLEELPLMIKAGAVLPLLPEDVDTLASYGNDSTTRLDEAANRLELIAFPRGTTTSSFGESGTIESKELGGGKVKKQKGGKKGRKPKGKEAVKSKKKKSKAKKRPRGWRLTITGAASNDVGLEASLTTMERTIRPCKVKVNDKVLKRKRWSVEDGVLSARFTTPPKTAARVKVLDRSSCNGKKKRKGKKKRR